LELRRNLFTRAEPGRLRAVNDSDATRAGRLISLRSMRFSHAVRARGMVNKVVDKNSLLAWRIMLA